MGDSMVLVAIIAVVLFVAYLVCRKKNVKKKLKVVALGDSVTYSAFGSEYSWTGIVAQETGIEVINAGWPGDTLEGMTNRFRRDVLAYMPTHCIIMGGANDAAAGRSLAQITDSLVRLISFCQQHNITPLVGRLIPVNPGNETIHDDAAKLVDEVRDAEVGTIQQLHVEMLDFYSVFLDDNGHVRSDLYVEGELRPNEAGCRIMADVVKRALAL